VGHTSEELDRECKEIGPKCDRDSMQREVPRTVVELEPFLMDVYEVTNQEMAETLDAFSASLHVSEDEEMHIPRFVRFNKDLGPSDEFLVDLEHTYGGIEYSSGRYSAKSGVEKHPVAQVTWSGARFFCTSRGKRLPTENEWEAASRGPDDRAFPWGNEPIRCGDVIVPFDGLIRMNPACPTSIEIADVGHATQDVTHEGIHDLAGNMSEWVDAAFVEGNRAMEGPALSALPKVIRGGSFGDSYLARTSGRFRRLGNSIGANVGFRCATRPSTLTKKE
jgi:formylglycine-generating enzyme required for sulfatase activity